MNHEEIQEALPELLAEALEASLEQMILAHLVTCAECRVELAFWAKLAKQLNDEAIQMPREIYVSIKAELFEHENKTMGFYESMQTVGEALSTTGKACRLALSLGGRL